MKRADILRLFHFYTATIANFYFFFAVHAEAILRKKPYIYSIQ